MADTFLRTAGFYVLAAFFEIAGCFAFWAWLRQGRTPWWTVAGFASLVLFAICLTRVDSAYAGRAFAAYGGVYIVASLVWLLIAEGVQPDRWDTTGAVVCLIGAALIVWGPRT
jgi:small multidrug resistance family-3 protein